MTGPISQDHIDGATQSKQEEPGTSNDWRPVLWPGVLVALLTTAAVVGPAYITDDIMLIFMPKLMAPGIGLTLLIVWWLVFSHTNWLGRLGVPALVGALIAVAWYGGHPSFQFGVIMYGLWAAVVAWPGWLLLSALLPARPRMAGLIVVLALVFGGCMLLRLDGIDGSMGAEISFRFSPTAEELNLAQREKDGTAVLAGEEVKAGPGDWLGFRGEFRDGVARGVELKNTNWNETPPKLLWERRVGPGWSSFVIIGDRLYTQEQLEEDEAVVCYQASTGKLIWTHRDEQRFTEVVAGAGPRATPTFDKGRIYTLGANGTLNCLDALTGKSVWKKAADIRKDSEMKKPPEWGYAASPCVAEGIVSVYAGGPPGKAVLGYDADTGELKWASGKGGHGYCSTQLAEIGEQRVLLAVSGAGLLGLDPKTGDVIIDYPWLMKDDAARCIQPTIVSAYEVLLGSGFKQGTRRIQFTTSGDGLEGTEVWSTKAISPYFNDQVVHKGHLYGFDGEFLTCVDLQDGSSKWRRRGFGNGQVLLLPRQDLILVQGEKNGVLALVEANPEEFREKGRFRAIEGKTWNHPVIAHGRLFIRNGEWMKCFEVK